MAIGTTDKDRLRQSALAILMEASDLAVSVDWDNRFFDRLLIAAEMLEDADQPWYAECLRWCYKYKHRPSQDKTIRGSMPLLYWWNPLNAMTKKPIEKRRPYSQHIPQAVQEHLNLWTIGNIYDAWMRLLLGWDAARKEGWNGPTF